MLVFVFLFLCLLGPNRVSRDIKPVQLENVLTIESAILL
jgi:hypothetical protein